MCIISRSITQVLIRRRTSYGPQFLYGVESLIDIDKEREEVLMVYMLRMKHKGTLEFNYLIFLIVIVFLIHNPNFDVLGKFKCGRFGDLPHFVER